MSLKIHCLHLLLSGRPAETTKKIKYPSTYGGLLAKIKWKTPQVCARIEKKYKKTKKIRILDIITRFNICCRYV